MTVDLYKTTSDPRQLTKALTSMAASVSCKPYEDIDILFPKLILAYNANYIGVNYAYISDYHRYYYSKITLNPGKQMTLHCSVDPLMSFDLSDIDILAIRSESAGINFFPDRQLPVDPNQNFLEGILFPQQPLQQPDIVITETDNYLLIVNGSGA